MLGFRHKLIEFSSFIYLKQKRVHSDLGQTRSKLALIVDFWVSLVWLTQVGLAYLILKGSESLLKFWKNCFFSCLEFYQKIPKGQNGAMIVPLVVSLKNVTGMNVLVNIHIYASQLLFYIYIMKNLLLHKKNKAIVFLF